MVTERCVAHDRKGQAPDDRVRLRVFHRWVLLLRSGLSALALPRQLAQAADHQFGPRVRHVVEAL